MNRVLMIALDAADVDLVERWMGDGTLPNLARLRRRGAFGRLSSKAEWLSGATWPTFYAGAPPVEHGLYHFLQWRAERMRFERPRSDWIAVRPFWREIADPAVKVLVVDPPSTYAPEPLNGIEIVGYAAHDRLHTPASYPQHVLGDVQRRFGVAPLGPEVYSSSGDLRLRDALLRSTTQLARMAEALMQAHAWNLCLVCLTATHRAGHRLWRTDPHDDAPSRAVKDVYAACDEAVGRLVETAGEGAACLVFALHGMKDNTSRVDVLDAMLERILGGARRPQRRRVMRRLLNGFPESARSRLKSHLPAGVQDRLSSHRWIHGLDWASRSAFALISDLPGYVRFNLKGREARGIVSAGSEQLELAARITEGLQSFVDSETRMPVVDGVASLRDLFGDGPRTSLLPDLSVRWAGTRAEHRAIESTSFGRIPWPVPDGHPTGRSGNHRGEGFVIAAGTGFAAGGLIEGATTMDLKPTVASLLGLGEDSRGHGRDLAEGQSGRPQPPAASLR